MKIKKADTDVRHIYTIEERLEGNILSLKYRLRHDIYYSVSPSSPFQRVWECLFRFFIFYYRKENALERFGFVIDDLFT